MFKTLFQILRVDCNLQSMATVIPRTRFKTLGILEPPLSSRKSEGYQVGPGAQSATPQSIAC